MSSLIVLCSHCLTWIEPHAQSCTECGVTVNVDDSDPAREELAARVGDRLRELGLVKLLRRGWPSCGRLVATTEGLLFVPQFIAQPNGSLEAVADEVPGGSTRVASLLHWWSLPPWRSPQEETAIVDTDSATEPSRPPLEMLLDSPGAFFMGRDTIQRITIRWGRAQIERRPSRSVTLSQAPGGPLPKDALRLLIEFPAWRHLVARIV